MSMSRRKILAASLLAGAGLAFSSTGRPAPPSERVRVGVIGTGVRGKYLIGNLPESAQVVAICDCATSRIASVLEPSEEFAPVLAGFRERDAVGCKTHQDYRRMFDRERLDAVIIATPDHHHTLAAMLALQAGLDVYLEKPLTVAIREGRLLANLVKKSGRVLQVGSQQRTMEINRFACELVKNGGLGKITRVELPNYPGPLPTASFAAEPETGGVNFDLFCGPAPLRPHHRRLWMKEDFKVGDLLWRGWDLFRDYSGHMMTNWGAHSVDMVQYALGRDDTGPVEIEATDNYFLADGFENWKTKTPAPTPARGASDRRFWPVTMRYADGVVLDFHLGAEDVVIHGTKGKMKLRRNYFETDPPELAAGGPDAAVAEKWKGNGHVARPHLENWLDCIRSRKTPNAPIEVGHRTVTVCHLANLARELNQPLRWQPDKEQFADNAAANQLLDRPRRKGFELPT